MVHKRTLLKQCLKGLGAEFDDNQVKVDQTTTNASQIWKLYGTKVCNGEHLPDRPRRIARILEAPESLEPVPTELLRLLAGPAPPTKDNEHYYRIHGSDFVVEFNNRQNRANHIHSVWREVENNFAPDVLREHLLLYQVI